MMYFLCPICPKVCPKFLEPYLLLACSAVSMTVLHIKSLVIVRIYKKSTYIGVKSIFLYMRKPLKFLCQKSFVGSYKIPIGYL